ncbi:glycoside hydrolase family protein [Solibacillus isronensis]|uniref:glycoside hydrolase family protein n=1 Tax=Solibacillus isronensis TaxID=412383 RepID=UPI0039A092CD
MTLFKMPVDHPRLTSKFDPKRLHPVLKIVRMHAGVDLINTKVAKAPIFATAAGTVRLVKTTKDGYGKYIIITHSINGQKYESVYAHLDSFVVKQGQRVAQGERIGTMGNTGIGTGIHLHFEIHKGSYAFSNYKYPNAIDPWPLIQPMKMQVSSAGVDLIKKWEGFRADAYLCPAKVFTIGYGTTKWPNGVAVKKGDKITQAEARSLLEQQVNEHASAIFDYVKIDLTQAQFDALASFCYNLGKHILGKDKALTNYINAKDWANVTRVMQLYNKVGGKVSQGLVNRRKDEVALFLNGLEEEKVYSSGSLKAEHDITRESAARRKIIVEAAIAAGYNTVWREKLEDGTITADDVDALATGTLIKNHKK